MYWNAEIKRLQNWKESIENPKIHKYKCPFDDFLIKL